MQFSRWSAAALVAVSNVVGILAMASPAAAKTDIQGDIHAVTLRVENATIDETLKALEAPFGLRYRASGNLAKSISGSYQGSLKDVVKRVLDGYDFVLTTRGNKIEVSVVGKSAAPAPVGAPNQNIVGVSKGVPVMAQPTPPPATGIQVAALQADRTSPQPAGSSSPMDGPVPTLVAQNDPTKVPTPNNDGSAMPMPTPSTSGDGPVPRPDMSGSASVPMPMPNTSGNGPVPMPPTPVAQPAAQPTPAPASQPALAPKPN